VLVRVRVLAHVSVCGYVSVHDCLCL